MLWIGLTGGLGSGKSTVAQILRKKGIAVIDADRKAREVIEKGSEGFQEVVDAFGPQVLGPDQEINRSELARLVFQSAALKEKLESIIHPKIQEAVRSERSYLQDQGLQIAFYDVPLLFEKNLQKQFDAVLVVFAPKELQIQRVRERNQWSLDEIESRLQNQVSLDQKKNQADYVIENTGTLLELEAQVEKTLEQIFTDLEKDS